MLDTSPVWLCWFRTWKGREGRREEEKEKENTHTLIQIPRPPAGSFIDGGISGVQLDHLICLRKSVQDGPNSNFVKIFF